MTDREFVARFVAMFGDVENAEASAVIEDVKLMLFEAQKIEQAVAIERGAESTLREAAEALYAKLGDHPGFDELEISGLDDLVHDLVSQEGSNINNTSVDEQIKLVFEHLGVADGTRAVYEALELKELSGAK